MFIPPLSDTAREWLGPFGCPYRQPVFPVPPRGCWGVGSTFHFQKVTQKSPGLGHEVGKRQVSLCWGRVVQRVCGTGLRLATSGVHFLTQGRTFLGMSARVTPPARWE